MPHRLRTFRNNVVIGVKSIAGDKYFHAYTPKRNQDSCIGKDSCLALLMLNVSGDEK